MKLFDNHRPALFCAAISGLTSIVHVVMDLTANDLRKADDRIWNPPSPLVGPGSLELPMLAMALGLLAIALVAIGNIVIKPRPRFQKSGAWIFAVALLPLLWFSKQVLQFVMENWLK
jgi:hypothetical protein